MDCLISSIQLLLLVFTLTPAVAGKELNLTILPSASVFEGDRTIFSCATRNRDTLVIELRFGRRQELVAWILNKTLVLRVPSIGKRYVDFPMKKLSFSKIFTRSQFSVDVKTHCWRTNRQCDENRLSVSFTAKPTFGGRVECLVFFDRNIMESVDKNLNVMRSSVVHSMVVQPKVTDAGENVTVTCSFNPGRPAKELKLESPAGGWKQTRPQSKQEPWHEVSWWKIVQRRDRGAITCCVGSVCKEEKLYVRHSFLKGTKVNLTIEPSTSVLEGEKMNISCASRNWETDTILMIFGQRREQLRWKIAEFLKFSNNKTGIDDCGIFIKDPHAFSKKFTKWQFSVKTKVHCFSKKRRSCGIDEHRVTVSFKAKPIFRGPVLCRRIVLGESDSTSAFLNVTWSPVVHSVVVQPEVANPGENVTVTCSFDPGNPAKELKLESIAVGWNRTPSRSQQERRHEVSWWKIVQRPDGGKITCCVGSVCEEAKLSVRPVVYSLVVRPEVADSGENVTVTCSFDHGNPAKEPKLESPAGGWKQTRPQSKQERRHEVSWWKIVQWRDRGAITCCLGSVCKDAKLSVRQSDTNWILEKKPRTSKVYFSRGNRSTVKLTCNIRFPGGIGGDLKFVHLTWYRISSKTKVKSIIHYSMYPDSDWDKENGEVFVDFKDDDRIMTTLEVKWRKEHAPFSNQFECEFAACGKRKVGLFQVFYKKAPSIWDPTESDTDWVLEKSKGSNYTYINYGTTANLTCDIFFPNGVYGGVRSIHLIWFYEKIYSSERTLIYNSEVDRYRRSSTIFTDLNHTNRIITTAIIKWEYITGRRKRKYGCVVVACGKKKSGIFTIQYASDPNTTATQRKNGELPNSITAVPRTMEKMAVGGLIFRDCKVSDRVGGNWTYQWTYPDGRTFSSGILYVPNLQWFHTGVYRCTATNERGRILETTFNASIADGSILVHYPSEKIIVPYFLSVNISCVLRFPNGVGFNIKSTKAIWRRKPRNGFSNQINLSDPFWKVKRTSWTTNYKKESITTRLLVRWRDIPAIKLNYDYACEFKSIYFQKFYQFRQLEFRETP